MKTTCGFEARRFDTFEELVANERLLIGRIAQTPNGGKLFFSNAIRLLELIGVELGPEARRRFEEEFPFLETTSCAAFDAIRASSLTQQSRVRIRGLFDRRKK